MSSTINQSIDSLVLRLQRRDLIGSRQTALETAQLLYRFVSAAKYASIEGLLEQIKVVGRRLVGANPKELAVGNIIRKVLRLIREEYKVAYTSHLASFSLSPEDFEDGFDFIAESHSVPGTPMPPTPGIHVPANHYLSTEFRNSGSGGSNYFQQMPGGVITPGSPSNASPPPSRTTSSPGTARGLAGPETSLSNFIQTRHSRVQLERAGSTLGMSMQELEQGMGRVGLGRSMTGYTRAGSVGSPTGSPVPDRQQSLPGRARNSISSPPAVTSPTAMETVMPVQQARAQTQQGKEAKDAFAKKVMQMKPVLVDAIREVVDEIETTSESCARGAREHVHSSEIILTIGYSKTVEAFLRAAWKDRNFTVIVAESAPSLQGHQMAKSLSSHGIPTLLIPDSSIHALMPRITKLLIGAHSVLANGGIFSISGTLLAALAAKAQSTPVVVVTGQYKFAPAWNLYHEFEAADFGDPGRVLGGPGKGEGEGKWLDKVEVGNPFYDYVKPDLINLFITNEGDHSPAYIFKIIKEAYDDQDVTL